MTRVLHVISGLAGGGAERALYRLVTSPGDECIHSVVTLTPGGVIAPLLLEAGIDLTHFDYRTAPISGFLGLVKLIKKTRPDIVQTWMYHADLLGGLAARLAGVRNIIWGIRVAELVGGDSRTTTFVRHACSLISRWVPTTIVCVAEAARRSHVNAGYDPTHMLVIPNGFDMSNLTATTEQRETLRLQCGFGPAQLVIGTIGRFNANKDHLNFVRTAGLLIENFDNVRFMMVGRDLDCTNAELIGWIKETGFADRFALLGERSDVPVCLSAMDVFCLSSRTEGFPNVVGEAMAMGLPCVVTDVGDSAFLIGKAGFVVPKEDYIALAKGLADMALLSPDERLQLGKHAKARIEVNFTIEKTKMRFQEIYRDLMSNTLQGRSKCAD